MELLITGRTFSPQEALDMGLVAALLPAEEAEARVREAAERLAAGPALAVAAIKRCVHEGGEASLQDGLALEAELIEELFRSRDATEGLTAFVEKRPPAFVGA
jgi:enoyl-CoA hydratase